MDDCSAIVKRIHPYLDGELVSRDSEDIDKHLEGCGGCREAFLAERDFLAMLRNHLARPSIPSALAACIKTTLPRPGPSADPPRNSS